MAIDDRADIRGRRMRALRKATQAPGLTLEAVPIPTPDSDEVLVRVEAASICGTDLHILHWDEWAQGRVAPPVTLGHEFVGTVVETGRDVRHFGVGDYVSAESHITCGRCFHCRTGQAHMCPETVILGVDRNGALAEFVTVPDSVLWRNDRSKLAPEIATLQEPFGNAVFATSAQDLSGQSVAVFGCGPIGLFTIAIAKAAGAASVFAVDRIPFRLSLASGIGATAALEVADGTDVSSELRELNDGYGVDVIFEMSGAQRAIRDAFAVVRNGGRVVLFGIPSEPLEIDVAEVIFKNVTVLGLNGRRIFETWFKTRWMLESGLVDLRPLITHRYGLEQFEQALEKLEAGEACKIVLYPGGIASGATSPSTTSTCP